MSDPNMSSTGAGSSTATQNADAQAVASGAGTAANGAAGAAPSGSDYLARVRAGGDWTVAEVQNQQRRADQAVERLKQLEQWAGSLTAYQQQGISGDLLAEHLDSYLEVLKRPNGKQILDQVRNGQADPTASTTPDEYLTDEEKKIRLLEQKVVHLESRLTGQDTSLGQQALIGHIGKVASEWSLTDQDRSAVAEYLKQQVNTWARQGETGLTAIRNLSSPDGWKTVEMLAIQRLGRERLSENLKAQILRNQTTRAGFATDVPSRGVPAGADPPPVVQSTLDALRMAQDEEFLTRHGY